MPSPFPGMDPYLERFWRDVHHRLITYAGDKLQAELPTGLRARIEERVFPESLPTPERAFDPDVHVVSGAPQRASQSPMADAPATDASRSDAPLILEIGDEPMTQGYLQIVESGTGGRVITIIEFVSPSNKTPGEGRKLYTAKQESAIAAGTNLVEIDLTRRGVRRLACPPERIPADHRTTYMACVTRGRHPGRAEIYSMPLDRPLPTIGIPLRDGDADAPLGLQTLIDQAYRNGGYDDLDYSSEADPPLEDVDRQLAERILTDARRRS